MKVKKRNIIKRISICISFIFILSIFILTNQAKSDENVPKLNITVTPSTVNKGINEDFTVTYHIEPQAIPVSQISPQTQKDIVLVIDTSGSMSATLGTTTRIEALKTAATTFINKFKDSSNVNIGIIDYDTYGKVITNTDSNGYIAATSNSRLTSLIGSLGASGGTNIGDGIRKALKILSANNNRKKYIVFMSDGEPTALTYTGQAGYNVTQQVKVGTKKVYYYGWHGNLKYYWEDVYENQDVYTVKESYDSRNSMWAWTSKFQENTSYWNYYTSLNDSSSMKYGGIYSTDYDSGVFLTYAKKMAALIKQSSITSYFIGFSTESNANKLSDISASAGGVYYDAKTSDAINSVYSNLADEIKADYTVEQVKFNFTMPDGLSYTGSTLNLTVNGNTYTKQLDNIVYTLNSTKDYYTAKPFDITINLKGTKSGTYDLSGQQWNITYKSLSGSVVNEIAPDVRITVSSLTMGFNLSRTTLPSSNLYIDSPFNMQYTVSPTPIVKSVTTKAKEVVLVLDTSSSMAQNLNGQIAETADTQKIAVLKNTAKNFISKLQNSSDVSIGIVTYNSGAAAKAFAANKYLISSNSTNTQIIKNAIDDITLSSGSNIGEGIRKALWVLSNNDGARKYIVVITDGTADYYSSSTTDSTSFYSAIDNESSSGGKVSYTSAATDENGINKGEDYSNVMAQTIKDNAVDTVINSYFIPLGSNSNTTLMNSLATTANGMYKDCTSSDSNVFNNTMLDIADDVRSEFIIKNATITESLPSGLQGSGPLTITLPNLVYIYKNGQYQADPVTGTISMTGTTPKSYTLSNDAVFSYKDLDGNTLTNKFTDFNLTILDDYIIKQGLFNNKATDTTTIGEGYLKTNTGDGYIPAVDNFLNRLGTFVRTTGQSTTVKIDIGQDTSVSGTLKSINMDSVKLYKVDSNNNLADITSTSNIITTKILDNSYEVSVSIPASSTTGYNYYVINYNFKPVGNDNNGYGIKCSASITGTSKQNDLYLKSVPLPPLF